MSQSGRPSGSGRGSRKDCLDFKLLGKCERHETGECSFSHTHKERYPASVAVKIPDNIPIVMATSKDFIRLLRSIAECRLRTAGKNSVEIVVSEFHASRLARMKKEYEILVSQLYPIGPGWCYIHRDGVEKCETGCQLKFQLYEGRIPPRPGQPSPPKTLLELCMDETTEVEGGSGNSADVKNPVRESETREGLHKAIDRAHEPMGPKHFHKDMGVKIIKNHEDHMKDMLRGGLEWFCEKKRDWGPYGCKLEGRFGKILWKNIPEDIQRGSFEIKQFADLCFTDTWHSYILTTDVQEGCAAAAIRELNEERNSLLETFDIKFTIPGGKERKSIDVRVMFEGGRPNVLVAKKNEAKIVVFNVLYLHRAHDIRVSLNYFEVLDTGSPEYTVVENLIRTLSLSDPDKGIITLQTYTDDWSVNFIRHKKREAYCVDDKHVLTVTFIRECQLEKHPRNELVSIHPDYYCEPHTEIEFHNCSWECAFGREVGFSPHGPLAVNPAVTPEVADAIPPSWQPDNILEDFQEFWENLDSINELLDANL